MLYHTWFHSFPQLFAFYVGLFHSLESDRFSTLQVPSAPCWPTHLTCWRFACKEEISTKLECQKLCWIIWTYLNRLNSDVLFCQLWTSLNSQGGRSYQSCIPGSWYFWTVAWGWPDSAARNFADSIPGPTFGLCPTFHGFALFCLIPIRSSWRLQS